MFSIKRLATIIAGFGATTAVLLGFATAASASPWPWPFPPPTACVPVTFQATSNGGWNATPTAPVTLANQEAVTYVGPGGVYGTAVPGHTYSVVRGAFGTFSLESGGHLVPWPGNQWDTVLNTLETC